MGTDRQEGMKRLSRRQVLQAGAAGVSVLSLWAIAGCAGQQPAPTAQAPAAQPTQAPAQQPAAPAAQPTRPAQQPAAAATGKDTITIAQGGVGSFPTTLDNAGFTSWLNAPYNLHDPLVRLEFENERAVVKPAIAESWKIVDDTTYEFKIRNAKFHNGEQVKASDVAFSLNRILDPANRFPTLAYFQYFGEAKVKDESTVIITTKDPYAPALYRLSFLTIIPERSFREMGLEEYGTKPVGAGPFKFVEWIKSDRVTLEAFPDYWAGTPKVRRLVFRDVKEPSTKIAMIQGGEADVMDNIPPPNVPQMEAHRDIDVKTVRTTRMSFAGFNVINPTPGENPFTDVRVRQAVNMAVDWDTIISQVLRGLAYRVPSAVSKALNGYAEIEPYKYDVAKAKELMTAAGYPNGFETTFDGPANRFLYDKEVAQALAANLERNLGIKSQMILADWGTFWEKYLGRRVTGLYYMSCGSLIGDADLCIQLHFHSKVRGIYYNSPKIDALLDDQARELDPGKRQEKLAVVQKAIQEEAPFVFGYDEAQPFGVRKGLNWNPRPDEVLYFYGANWQ